MITKLNEDYMVSGMLNRKIELTNELKMVYVDVNLEKMTIGYKNHHLEIKYVKQYGFKQVFSYEVVPPLKMKQGFKITFSDSNIELYTISSKEYEICLKALKDYFFKKLKREKQILKEDQEKKWLLGTDLQTNQYFNAREDFNNWSFSEEENQKVIIKKSGKKLTKEFSEEQETTHNVKGESNQQTIKYPNHAKQEFIFETFELKNYYQYKKPYEIEQTISLTLDKKRPNTDLYEVKTYDSFWYVGLIKLKEICHLNFLEIDKTVKPRAIQSTSFEIKILKPPNRICKQNIGFELDKTPKIIKPQKMEYFEYIYKRFANLIQDINCISCELEPTPKIIEFEKGINLEFLRKPMITIFDKRSSLQLEPTPKILEIRQENVFSVERKKPIIRLQYLDTFRINPTKKNYQIMIESSFIIAKRAFRLEHTSSEKIHISPTKHSFEAVKFLLYYPKITSFNFLEANNVYDIQLSAVKKIFMMETSELTFFKRVKPLNCENVHSLTIYRTLRQLRISEEHLYYPKITSFNFLEASNVYDIQLSAVEKIFMMETSELTFFKRVKPLNYENVQSLTIYRTLRQLRISEEHLYYPKITSFNFLEASNVYDIRLSAVKKIFMMETSELTFFKRVQPLNYENVQSLTIYKTLRQLRISEEHLYFSKRVQPLILYTNNPITIFRTLKSFKAIHQVNIEYQFHKWANLNETYSGEVTILPIKKIFSIASNFHSFEVLRKVVYPLVIETNHSITLYQTRKAKFVTQSTEKCEMIVKRVFKLNISKSKENVSLYIPKKDRLLLQELIQQFTLINNFHKKPRLEFDNNRSNLINIISSNHKTKCGPSVEKIENKVFYDDKESSYKEHYDYNSNSTEVSLSIMNKEQYQYFFDEEHSEKISKNPIFGGVNFTSQRYKFKGNKLNDYILKF